MVFVVLVITARQLSAGDGEAGPGDRARRGVRPVRVRHPQQLHPHGTGRVADRAGARRARLPARGLRVPDPARLDGIQALEPADPGRAEPGSSGRERVREEHPHRALLRPARGEGGGGRERCPAA
jgi:hypothetical protein